MENQQERNLRQTSGTVNIFIMKEKKGMGFKAAAASIAKKQGVSAKSAGAILASATRKASPTAKKANPNLKKVKK